MDVTTMLADYGVAGIAIIGLGFAIKVIWSRMTAIEDKFHSLAQEQVKTNQEMITALTRNTEVIIELKNLLTDELKRRIE